MSVDSFAKTPDEKGYTPGTDQPETGKRTRAVGKSGTARKTKKAHGSGGGRGGARGLVTAGATRGSGGVPLTSSLSKASRSSREARDSRAWRTPAGRGATRFASPRPRKRVERSFCAFHDAMKARGGAVERGGAMTTGLKTTIFDRLRSRERACAAAPGAVGDGCDL